MLHLIRQSRFVAVGAVAAIALAACGGGDDTTAEPGTTDGSTAPESTDSPSESESEATTAGDPFASAKLAADHVVGAAAVLAGGIDAAANLDGETDSPAAGLRSGLTALLQEHVYLAGIAVDTGVGFGLDSAEFGLAAGALDTNSVQLSEAVASIAGPENGDAFLNLWREHIGFFVQYTEGKATGDDAKAQDAQDKLDGYRADAGAFFENITGGALPADAVAENLKGHIETLSSAIDAVVAGDTSAFSKLKMAAAHVNGSAKVLAGGIATAAGLEGDPNSAASEARAALTQLLQEHVYLAGIAVKTAFAAGADSEAFGAAAGVLDENSVNLSKLVGSVAGPDNETAFLNLWREHIGFFVEYALGAAGNDDAAKAAADEKLQGYTGDAGAFFENITGGALPADAVAGSLKMHISTLELTIDDLAAAIIK